MKKMMWVIAVVIGVAALSAWFGYSYAQQRYAKELALQATVNANTIVGALFYLEKENSPNARAMLMVAIDGDLLKMRAYDKYIEDKNDQQFQLDMLKRIVQLKKKYPNVPLPETSSMYEQLDAYLTEKTAQKK